MKTVDIKLPFDLVEAANLDNSYLSQDTARLLALELYREDKVSLGRAAELCQTPLALLSLVAYTKIRTSTRARKKLQTQTP